MKQNKKEFVITLMVMLFFVSVLSYLGDDIHGEAVYNPYNFDSFTGSLRGAQKSFAMIYADTEESITAQSGLTSIRKVTFVLNEQAQDVQITLENPQTQPRGTKTISYPIYEYNTVEATNVLFSSVKESMVNFRVERDWITRNRGNPEDVHLYWWSGSEWIIEPATVLHDDFFMVNYTAEAGGLGHFAIGLYNPPRQKTIFREVEEPVEEVPFELPEIPALEPILEEPRESREYIDLMSYMKKPFVKYTAIFLLFVFLTNLVYRQVLKELQIREIRKEYEEEEQRKNNDW